MSRNFKKGLLFTVISVIILLLTVIIIKILYPNPRNEAYILKTENNYIVLYHENKIINTYKDIVTDNIPFEDRKKLQKGIEFKTVSEVNKLIEDYDG